MRQLQQKKLRSFRFGRVNTATESRRQARIRKSLEKSGYTRINSLFRKTIRTEAYNYELTGVFSNEIAANKLTDELGLVLRSHYKRIFTTIYSSNEDKYENNYKSIEAAAFGRNEDIEGLIEYFANSRFVNLANASTKTMLAVEQVIQTARADGLSLSQIGKEINKRAPSISRKRAATIARTETHNAASYANHEYHSAVEEQLGMTMMKRWVSTGDARTRSAHVLANGQTVAMDEPFSIGGVAMQHAGDPAGGARNVINCRCVIVYVDAQDLDNVVDNSPMQVAPQEDITVGNVKVSASGLVLNKTKHSDTMSKLATGVTINQIKKNLKKQIDENFKDKKWDVIGHDQHRFNTSDVLKDYGQTKFDTSPAYIRRNKLDPEDVRGMVSTVEDTLPELNAISVSFGLPPLRGIRGVGRAKAPANMGDGVLGIGTVELTRWYKHYKPEKISWTQGTAKALKPDSVTLNFENGTDRVKSMLYHEMGHHIHQMHKVRTKTRYAGTRFFYDDGWKMKDAPDVEKELKKTKGRKSQRSNAPSVYGESNDHEWFAENFSAWQMGLNDVIDPDFFPLIEKIKKESIR